ncbi:hypothetical protein L6R52_11100 [Myxococcota bacterium]|nr:hypothetical protein [Myxococcota bacterium]
MLVLSAGLGACRAELAELEEPEETNRFITEIVDDYFDAIDYEDPRRRAGLSSFVERFDDVVGELEADVASGALSNAYDLEAVGRVYFFYGHMLHSSVLVTLEGRITAGDLRGRTVTPEGTRAELEEAIDRAVSFLERAADYRPNDRRPKVALLAARTTRARVMQGHTNKEDVQALIAYATDPSRTAVEQRAHMTYPNFDLMVAMLTLRNVADDNLRFLVERESGEVRVNAHMLNLTGFVHRRITPEIGPGTVEPTEEQLRSMHFVTITAPLLRSDYFTRYAYDLIRAKRFDDAQTELYTAQTAMTLVREKLWPLVEEYPIPGIVERRDHFHALLQRAIDERSTTPWDEDASGPREVTLEEIFLEPSFTSPYLCANCHAEH